MTGIYYRDSVYVPFCTILKQLRVDETIDMHTKTVRGFYINTSDKYDINFITGLAVIRGKKIKFDTSSVIIGKLDFYVLPSFFKRVFDLSFSVNFSSLSLVLNTTQELPIVRDYKRETRRNYSIVSPEANLMQAPLLYPRRRHLLDGGILDYSLSAYKSGNLPSYNYQLSGGAEILGGETEGSLMGTASGTNSNIYSSTISWKYAFDSSAYITYAGLGNLSSNGLARYGYRGFQVSNEPLTVRTLFGQYVVKARTNPGWDVELYMNSQLVGYKTADAKGRAQFTVPLVYGTSYLQIKYYGPNGQFREEDRRLQIPFTFVPVGQVNYTVSAGKVNNTDYNLLSTNVLFGLTDWMTDKIGMDYVDDPLFSKPLLYNSLSLRLGSEYTLSLDAAPSAFYRSTFTALYASQTSFDVGYARYSQNLLYNPSLKLQEMQADAFLPIFLGRSNFNFRVAGSAQEYVGGQKAYSYSAGFSTSLSQFNASISYVRSVINYGGGSPVGSYDLSASILYSLFFQQGAFSFLNGTLLNVTSRYGVLKNSLDDISFQLSRNVQRYIRIGFSADKSYVNNSTTYNLQIIADLPFTRSTSNALYQNGTAFYNENVSGSIGFDSNYGSFLFNNLGWVGRSAASIRMFVDSNGNGRYDKGEQIIKNGDVTLRQAVASETSGDGVTRDWNLLPYTRYTADVDAGSIRNPLWIPKEKSFSFVTDPDSYKRIDIPFFVGGIVDGTVLREVAGKLSAIAGLSLEIKSEKTGMKKTVAVFNDGSFYYMGLPPGDYEACVDSAQLSMLGVYADPAVLRFTVTPTKDGDFIEGLKILLKTKKSEVVQPPPKRVPPKAEQAIVNMKEIPEKYVVQIGAFTTRDRAKRLAKRARIMTGQMLVERYSPKSGLYVVQTDTFASKQTALDRLKLLINRFGFSGAFVNSTPGHKPKYLFSVELRSFSSEAAARSFASLIRRQTKFSPAVKFKRSTHLFAVTVGPFKSEKKAEGVMDLLRKRRDCRRALVVVDGEAKLP